MFHLGTSLYDSVLYSLYNFVLGWPIVILGIFDKDVSELAALRRPQLYLSGRLRLYLNLRRMTEWIVVASKLIIPPPHDFRSLFCEWNCFCSFYLFLISILLSYHEVIHAVIIYSVSYFACNNTVFNGSGIHQSSEYIYFGTVIYSSLIFAMQFKVFILI